jgi:two-component SAPR family response regulator
MSSALNGPIILVDDDIDDQEIIKEVIAELDLPNKVNVFSTCLDAFSYLMDTPDNPMIIISDINLPLMNGIDFKRKVDDVERLKKKSIPFVFLTTTADRKFVEEAYLLKTQGYFQKPTSIRELKVLIAAIFTYWRISKHPG